MTKTRVKFIAGISFIVVMGVIVLGMITPGGLGKALDLRPMHTAEKQFHQQLPKLFADNSYQLLASGVDAGDIEKVSMLCEAGSGDNGWQQQFHRPDVRYLHRAEIMGSLQDDVNEALGKHGYVADMLYDARNITFDYAEAKRQTPEYARKMRPQVQLIKRETAAIHRARHAMSTRKQRDVAAAQQAVRKIGNADFAAFVLPLIPAAKS
jgi:hypothetical protein